MVPSYPIYIPSRGRAAKCLTARCLDRAKLPFHLVIEREEYQDYADHFDTAHLLMLPFSNRGLIAARNWIKDHATNEGHKRHWQLDDNIQRFYRRHKARRAKCPPGPALCAVESFTDRYENIAVAGMNYDMFMPDYSTRPPFNLNVHVYSCSLILNALPHRWRSLFNDDTDFCLQVLADGWCTVLFNALLCKKMWTMKIQGGNTPIYQGDGRLKMARSLERQWPGVVRTDRRFQRPQHVVRDSWRKFDTPLIRRTDIDWEALEKGGPNEYGMVLKQVKEEVKSPELRALLDEQRNGKS